MIRVRVTRGAVSVEAEGATLASAVRRAVGRKGLGLGPGRTVSRVEAPPGSGRWTWDWSGVLLEVEVLPRKRASGPSGRTRTYAEERAAGTRLISVRLDASDSAIADELARRHGGVAEGIRVAMREARGTPMTDNTRRQIRSCYAAAFLALDYARDAFTAGHFEDYKHYMRVVAHARFTILNLRKAIP